MESWGGLALLGGFGRLLDRGFAPRHLLRAVNFDEDNVGTGLVLNGSQESSNVGRARCAMQTRTTSDHQIRNLRTLRRQEVALESVLGGGNGKVAKDSTAVIVDHDDRERFIVRRGVSQSANVVTER